MENQSKNYTAEFKSAVLREHLENQVLLGKAAKVITIHPNLLYLWEKIFFENAATVFQRVKGNKADKEKIRRRQEGLKNIDSLISELVEHNPKMKMGHPIGEKADGGTERSAGGT